jgi:esterase/lipase superfamily enzyme
MNGSRVNSRSAILVVVVSCIVLAGCHREPLSTPVVFHDGRVDPCARVPAPERTTQIQLFYATSRRAAGTPDAPRYTNDVSDELRLGSASVQLGDDSTTWERLCAISTGKLSVEKLPMSIRQMQEFAGSLEWSNAINRQLDRTPNKQINIYVHGCNTDLGPELLTAAPFFHYVGRGGAMIVFGWPSRQRISLYGSDIERSRAAAPHLASLIEMLARNTSAQRINILAYSAGGHAMSQALIQLREARANADAAALQRELHVGNVVFAGSDLDLKGFATDDLTRFLDLPSDVTVYISSQDNALVMAAAFGAPKLGNPRKQVLTREQLDRLATIDKLHVVDVSQVPGTHTSGGLMGHGYWYSNEWVMSDILTIFRWNLPPQVRGLHEMSSGKWTFPKDYPTRVTQAVVDELTKEKRWPTTNSSASR